MMVRARRLARRVHSWWPVVHWPLIAMVGSAAFVLGYVGFRTHASALGLDQTALDRVYLTLQLYTLESGSVAGGDTPWQLEVARFAAPATTAAALLAALAAALREQARDWRLRHEHDHIVICGLGTTGARLAMRLLEAGHRVVGVDADDTNPALVELRRRGATILVGEARDPSILERVRIDRATHLVCLTGADDANAEVAVQAAELLAARTAPPLLCLARIRDPHLSALMRSEQLSNANRGGVLLDFFNIDELGARLMLDSYPPQPAAEGAPPRILVLGLSRFGQSLIPELARRWHSASGSGGTPLAITVVDPDATLIVDALRRRFPQLDRTAKITDVNADLELLDEHVVTETAPSSAYVCVDDDSTALRLALLARHALAAPDAAVVAELNEASGLGSLMDRPGDTRRVNAFNVLDHTMAAGLLEGGTYEMLAQAVHAQFIDDERRRDPTASKPSMREWHELDPTYQESNRAAAAHIGTKLARLGMVIAPLTDWDADRTTFSADQVDEMARMEYERFIDERASEVRGDRPRLRRRPTSLPPVGWDDLGPSEQDKNRQIVRTIPALLARAGYQVIPGAGRA